MLIEYMTGLLLVVTITVLWVAVQNAWRRAFPDGTGEPDVLAARRCREEQGCHVCGCVSREIEP